MKPNDGNRRSSLLAALMLALLSLSSFYPALAQDDPAAAPAQPSSNGKPANKYRKSRLTHDESEATADRRRLTLAAGEDKAVDIDFEVSSKEGVAIAKPELVLAKLVTIGNKQQIVFRPIKPGDTTVTVRDADGNLRLVFNVKINPSNLLRIASELRDLLRDLEGLQIRIVGSRVVLEGELLVPADYARVLMVLDGDQKNYRDNVINLTTLSPLAMQVIAKRIEADIKAFAQNLTVRVVNGTIFIEGNVDTQDEANRATQIAMYYLPDPRPGDPLVARDASVQKVQDKRPIKTFIVVNPKPQKKQEKLVRITVHFVELVKDYTKNFGFKWQPGFTADPKIEIGTTQNGSAGTGASGAATNPISFSATISSLIPKLQSAQAAGYGRVLKTSTVIVRSGQTADLSETTDYPYALMGGNGQVSQGKEKIGVVVSVTPQILGQSEDIQMNLNLEQMSMVSRGTASTGGAPITSSHKVKTALYVKSNESAAVAGVSSADLTTIFNKDDPKAGDFGANTDPLFNLVRTKAFSKRKSQFVIFVTPQIVENASDGTEDLRKNFRVKVK